MKMKKETRIILFGWAIMSLLTGCVLGVIAILEVRGVIDMYPADCLERQFGPN